MPFFDRLERRFRRYAIPHLTAMIVAGQGLLYVLSYMSGGLSLDRIALNPERVLNGEVWRLVTFPFMPPPMIPVFAIFYFLLLYQFGTSLENYWGLLRYNLFLGIGLAASIVAAFIAYAILRGIEANDPQLAGLAASQVANNGFLYSSIFLAFARLNPNFTMMLFFVLPVPIKYLALVQWAFFFLTIAVGDWMSRMLVIATVLNYMLFFGREQWREARYNRRRHLFQLAAKVAIKPPTHVCRVCGANSEDSPRMPFRYCSKCDGQACYCPEHIRDHEHVVAAGATSAGEGR